MHGGYAGMGKGCICECDTRKDLVGIAKEQSFIKYWPKGQPAGFHLYAKGEQPVTLPFLPHLSSHQGFSWGKLSPKQSPANCKENPRWTFWKAAASLGMQ